jgi:hypothetical protein
MEKSDHRHRRLLRVRGERPRGGATQQRNEFASFQLFEMHSAPAGQGYR